MSLPLVDARLTLIISEEIMFVRLLFEFREFGGHSLQLPPSVNQDGYSNVPRSTTPATPK
jgi:hypothetical protein